MARDVVLVAVMMFGVGSSALGGVVQMSFSGGNGAPLTLALPRPISYTVAVDTPNAGTVFVFRNVGALTAGGVRFGVGSLSYTVNGGAVMQIDRAGTVALGGSVDANDVSLFHTPSGAVNLNDVVLLSPGTFSMTGNVAAPPPPAGFYEAILTDTFGNQVGSGTTITNPPGDYNFSGWVDAADYVVWRDTDRTASGYNMWRANFGAKAGVGGLSEVAVPEARAGLLVVWGVAGVLGLRRKW